MNDFEHINTAAIAITFTIILVLPFVLLVVSIIIDTTNKTTKSIKYDDESCMTKTIEKEIIKKDCALTIKNCQGNLSAHNYSEYAKFKLCFEAEYYCFRDKNGKSYYGTKTPVYNSNGCVEFSGINMVILDVKELSDIVDGEYTQFNDLLSNIKIKLQLDKEGK